MAELSPHTRAILPEAVDNLIGSLSLAREKMSPEAVIRTDSSIEAPDTITWSKEIAKYHGLNPERPEIQAVIDGVWAMVFEPIKTLRAITIFRDHRTRGRSYETTILRTAAVYEPDILKGQSDPGKDRIKDISELPLSIARGISLMSRCLDLEELV
jgi:hypothetical protein